MTMNSTIDQNPSKDSSNHQIHQDLYQRLQPKNYLSNLIQQSIRPDGRSLSQSRPLNISTGSITSAHGSSLVSIGRTSVVCGIKFEVAQPDLMRPHQGFLVPNVEMGGLCASKFKPGPPNDEAQVMTSKIRDIIKSAALVPLKSLVIHSGKLVWVVYIDVICLSHDGNILDASILAIHHALQNARRPEVKFETDQDQPIFRPDLIPQSINKIPSSLFPMTFAIFDKHHILPDPTLFEEEQAEGFITLVIDESHTIRYLSYHGSISPQTLDGKKTTLDYCLELTIAQLQSQSSR